MAKRAMLLRAKTLAHDLAAGRFQSFANIERELIAFGNENEIALIIGPVRNTVERDCVSERAREIAAWRIQTAC
jgi:hypothetical protein